jgi:glutamate decarboxylase
MAPNVEHIKMLRVVVREDFSRSRCEILVKDIIAALRALDTSDREAVAKRREHIEEHSHSSIYSNDVNPKSKTTGTESESTEDSKTAQGIC